MTRKRAAALIAALSAIAIVGAACSDDGDGADDASPTARATSAATSAATRPAATAGAAQPSSTPAAGATSAPASDEVRGIVGAVNAGERTITITRLSGAQVTRIIVSPTTEIRRARGGTATLSEIRPSDRIIAQGAVSGGALEATRITVEDVIPGAAPGG